MGGRHLNAPVVDIAPHPGGRRATGWLAADGGIFSFGDASFYGSMGGRRLNRPIVGISADDATGGYWEVASRRGDLLLRRTVPGQHRRDPAQPAGQRHGVAGGRTGVLVRGLGRRDLLRGRCGLPRIDGWGRAQRPGGGHGLRSRPPAATGWWPPTVASSVSMPPSTVPVSTATPATPGPAQRRRTPWTVPHQLVGQVVVERLVAHQQPPVEGRVERVHHRGDVDVGPDL